MSWRRSYEKEILHWPGGYAAEIPDGWYGTERCCGGHPTPQEAMEHGLARYRQNLEDAIAAWRNRG